MIGHPGFDNAGIAGDQAGKGWCLYLFDRKTEEVTAPCFFVQGVWLQYGRCDAIIFYKS